MDELGQTKQPKSRKKNAKGSYALIKEILSWILSFAIAFAAAFLITRFIIANSTVPTGSMENTIMQGDRVIGSRLKYLNGDPERGDVVIFDFGWMCDRCGAQGQGEFPDACPYCGGGPKDLDTLYYLKRTIGLPGDRVEIRQAGTVRQGELSEDLGLDESMGDDALLVTAAVFINGEELTEDYLKEPMLYTGDMEFEVPEGCYFFLGDNRNNSLDARYWADPYIPKDRIIAKVLFRYWPRPAIIK